MNTAKTGWVRILLAVGLAAAARAEVTPEHVRLALDVTAEVRGVTADDDMPLSLGPDAAGPFTAALAAALPARVAVDALWVDGPFIVFSTDVDCVVDSLAVADDDLVAFDACDGSFSKRFDGRTHGVPARADLDAAAAGEAWGGELLLSFDVTCDFPGPGRVADHELTVFDGTNFTAKVAVPGMPPERDVDAVSVHDGRLSFSLDGPAEFGGAAGFDEDVWEWDMATTDVVRIDMPVVPRRADLAALDEPRDEDGDGLTRFEEASGTDDPSTTWGGSGQALDPAGRPSDPGLADSDGDGFDDGEEAICGTHPWIPTMHCGSWGSNAAGRDRRW